MSVFMNELVNEYVSGITREYNRMLSEMLMNYKINVLDLDEVKRRVYATYDETGKKRHFYIDGLYAFTISEFTRIEDDWGVNGNYRFRISHKIEFLDKLMGDKYNEE